jgi:hypothetical protein
MSMRVACVLLALLPGVATAQPLTERSPLANDTPFAAEVRQHYYQQLAKDPWRAFGAELIMPGAGNYYVGLHVPAAITFALSCVGAGLWIAGAVRDQPALRWSGIGAFSGARVYGAISAPIGAKLLNRAFRRQLGISAR